MFEDKDVEGVLAALAPLAAADAASRRPAARPARGADPSRVAAAAAGGRVRGRGEFDTVADAVAAARADAGEDDLILVTGSFYTVADARPLFLDA